MRRLVFSGVLMAGLAFGVPVGASAGPSIEAGPEGVTPMAVQVPAPFGGLREEAAMVLVGTALIGLAAAVRRAA
jgi:hypothetical protein